MNASPQSPTPIATKLECVGPNTVLSLSWRMSDAQGELLDELLEPIEFLLGQNDLLPAIENALIGKNKGDTLELNLEPEHAFGDYREEWVAWAHRADCPEDVAEGDAMLLLPGSKEQAPDGQVWIVTEVYPEHIVLDANHPLAGIALRLDLKIHDIRTALPSEVAAQTAGTGFFRMRDFLTE